MVPSADRRAASPPPGRVRIVADYVTQRGGAERVNLAFHQACPGSALTTSFYDQAHTYPEFGHVVIEASRFNRFPRMRRAHRAAFPIYPFRFGLLEVDNPVVICSTTGWSHWVKARGRKVIYWHAPARWLYQTDAYTGATGLAARAVGLVAPILRRWDRAATASADVHLCNSTEIANRLRRIYGIEAEVLPPPHGMDPNAPQEATPGLEPGFHLCVSRLLPYKNVEAVVAAFEHLPDQRLVVVGEGPGRRALEQERPPNVELYSNLTDARLRWLYANCQALVAASYEDFGLTPLEAGSFGRPTIALRWGGFLDTVEPGLSGLFFDQPTADRIAQAVKEGVSHQWDTEAIKAHAATFNAANFRARVLEVVQAQLGDCAA
jgi:glycosyltransferase involved in cell wall biosynthesis